MSSPPNYPTVEEFKSMLLSEPLQNIVGEHIFRGTPYVFRDNPEYMDTLRAHLCPKLRLRALDVIVVGSGRTGFSLSPTKFPRAFYDGSDLDILIVDMKLFDTVWENVLRWHYPRKGKHLSGADGEWMSARRRELYWGWFIPDAINYESLSLPRSLKPLRDISARWFDAFQSLSLYDEFASRKASGRLYRTWNHALMYQLHGLEQLRQAERALVSGV